MGPLAWPDAAARHPCPGAPPPSPRAQLPCTFEQQQGCNWCWSASRSWFRRRLGTKQINATWSDGLSPSTVLSWRHVPPGMTNCSGQLNLRCKTGWPPFQEARLQLLPDEVTRPSALNGSCTKSASPRDRSCLPGAWHDSNGARSGVGHHMVVAGGYKTVDGDRFVEVYDPLCPASRPRPRTLPAHTGCFTTKYVSRKRTWPAGRSTCTGTISMKSGSLRWVLPPAWPSPLATASRPGPEGRPRPETSRRRSRPGKVGHAGREESGGFPGHAQAPGG